MSFSNNPVSSGAIFTLDMAKDSITGNQVQKVALTEPAGGTFITPMQQTGGQVSIVGTPNVNITGTPNVNASGSTVTPLNSGALANPTSTLTRPSSAVTATVNFTAPATPCVFTWSSNPVINGQTVVLTGSVPGGFTAGLAYYVVGQSGNNFSLAATFGGTAINSTGSAGSCTATLTYVNGNLIGSAAAAGSIVVPNFAMPATGIMAARIRLTTNITAAAVQGSYAGQSWSGVNLSVNLWSAAPTYLNGDDSPYAPVTGGANWLANFIVGLTQFGDAATGFGTMTGASQMWLKVGGAQNLYWDIQVLSQVAPIVSQTFTISLELGT
jgi:hypothetical protein